MRFCVTTVLLPTLTMLEQAELLQRLGYDGIELRVRRVPESQRDAAPSNWGRHINDITPENLPRKAPAIRSILDGHGLSLAALASNAACTDLEQVQLLIEGAVAVGAPLVRIGAAAGYDGSRPYRDVYGETVAGYARVLELMKGTGVKAVLEIHGGTIHPSASLAHRIVSQFDPSRVGVIYDPQNMVRDGFETTALALDLLGPYVAHCHVGGHRPLADATDESGTRKWKWEHCPMSEGLYDYPTMLRQLHAIGYDGFISVEDFAPRDTESKLADALAYLKSIQMLR